MWVFTSDSFVSVVQHRDDPDHLIVRGRFAGDASRFLGLPVDAEEVTPAADYRFRCYAHRDVVAAALLRAVQDVDYGNFKKTVTATWRERLYLGVWSLLWREQSARAPKPRKQPVVRLDLADAIRREDTAQRLGDLLDERAWPERWRSHELSDAEFARDLDSNLNALAKECPL